LIVTYKDDGTTIESTVAGERSVGTSREISLAITAVMSKLTDSIKMAEQLESLRD
jgi:hypothetical protein